jgi:hypothetical protein
MANPTYSQRTFSKIANVADNGTLSVSCVDSSGQLIDCNYLESGYTTSTGSTPAYCFVSPRVGSEANVTSLNITALTSTAGSGALGTILCSRSTPSYKSEYLCLGSEKFNIIDLKVSGVGGQVLLTYGVIKPISDIRLTDRQIYDTGR